VEIRGGDASKLSLSRTDVEVERRGSGSFEIDSRGRDIAIIVPERVKGDILVRVVSGDVALRGLRANVRVEKISGNIDIRDLVGQVRIKITSGDISLEGVTGNVNISSTSGRIEGQDVKGSLEVDSWSSDVKFAGLAGEADVQVVSGNVALEVIPPLKVRYKVETTSGNIDFGLPGSTSARVDLKSSTGNVGSSLPVAIRKKERGLLQGVIGRGDVSVRLDSTSGNINLYPIGEAVKPKVAEVPEARVEEKQSAEEESIPTEEPPPIEGPKAKLAVLSLRDANPAAERDRLGQVIAGMLVTSLVQTDSFIVVERDKLESLLSEQRLSQSGVVNAAEAREIGKILGVDILIVGDAVRFDNLIEMDVRLLDTKTGEVILARSARSDGVRELRAMVNSLAGEVARRYYGGRKST
jgi:TolB-like protein